MKGVKFQLNRYPFKYAVLFAIAMRNQDMKVDEIMNDLSPDFGNEKQFTEKMVRYHMDSFVCVGMAKVTKEKINSDGNLEMTYCITPFGMERTKFLPDEWKNLLSKAV